VNCKALAVSLMALLALSAVVQAYAAAYPDDAHAAENIVRAAETALFRVESFVNSTLQNPDVVEKLESLGLMDALHGNASLLEQAEALLAEAKASLEAGNYAGAVAKAMEAMKICRDVFRNVHEMLERAGLGRPEVERPELQAQGLLVAAERSLERIRRIKEVLPENAPELEALIGRAEALLNATEIEQLLGEGRVSEAAHRLADANGLIAQAFSSLKAKAEEMAAERVERFVESIKAKIGEAAGKMDEAGLGEAMRGLGFGNVSEFRAFIEGFASQAREHLKAGRIGEAVGKLKGISEKFKEFAKACEVKAFEAKAVQPVGESTSLRVGVEVSVEKRWTLVEVTVENSGNATVVFPNSAFGSIVEKDVDGKWVPYYSPISAQALVKLKPGEAGSFSMRLFDAGAGRYRVVVHGFSEETMTPVSASAEFTVG